MSEKKSMLEYFELEWTASPQDWERQEFYAIPRGEFSLISGNVVMPFCEGSTAIASFSGTDARNKSLWNVVVLKNGFAFKMSASQFFKLFKA